MPLQGLRGHGVVTQASSCHLRRRPAARISPTVIWACPTESALKLWLRELNTLKVAVEESRESKNPLSGLCSELALVLPHCPALIWGWLQLSPGFTTGSRRCWSLSCHCVVPGELLHLDFSCIKQGVCFRGDVSAGSLNLASSSAQPWSTQG